MERVVDMLDSIIGLGDTSNDEIELHFSTPLPP